MFCETPCMFCTKLIMSSFTFPRILFKKLHLADFFRSFLFTQHFANACLSLADSWDSSSHWLKYINIAAAGRRSLLQSFPISAFKSNVVVLLWYFNLWEHLFLKWFTDTVRGEAGNASFGLHVLSIDRIHFILIIRSDWWNY